MEGEILRLLKGRLKYQPEVQPSRKARGILFQLDPRLRLLSKTPSHVPMHKAHQFVILKKTPGFGIPALRTRMPGTSLPPWRGRKRRTNLVKLQLKATPTSSIPGPCGIKPTPLKQHARNGSHGVDGEGIISPQASVQFDSTPGAPLLRDSGHLIEGSAFPLGICHSCLHHETLPDRQDQRIRFLVRPQNTEFQVEGRRTTTGQKGRKGQAYNHQGEK
jgi:hypothetical protein